MKTITSVSYSHWRIYRAKCNIHNPITKEFCEKSNLIVYKKASNKIRDFVHRRQTLFVLKPREQKQLLNDVENKT